MGGLCGRYRGQEQAGQERVQEQSEGVGLGSGDVGSGVGEGVQEWAGGCWVWEGSRVQEQAEGGRVWLGGVQGWDGVWVSGQWGTLNWRSFLGMYMAPCPLLLLFAVIMVNQSGKGKAPGSVCCTAGS